jgi:hypothetical protein
MWASSKAISATSKAKTVENPVLLKGTASHAVDRWSRKSRIIRFSANFHSATSIIFAHNAFVPASVFAEIGRMSSTSCAFFSAATDFAN